MPTKRDDEAGTPEEEAAIANVTDTEVLLHDLEKTQELVMRQEALIQRLSEQVEKLAQTAESDVSEEPLEVVADLTPQPPPDGHRRYASRYGELTMIKTAGRKILVDGNAVFIEADRIDFTGGVFQTMDYSGPTPLPDLIEWMESHPDFHQTFWIDEYAIRRHSTVEVTTGLKATTSTPRAPLVAPMQ